MKVKCVVRVTTYNCYTVVVNVSLVVEFLLDLSVLLLRPGSSLLAVLAPTSANGLELER